MSICFPPPHEFAFAHRSCVHNANDIPPSLGESYGYTESSSEFRLRVAAVPTFAVPKFDVLDNEDVTRAAKSLRLV